MPHDDAGRHLYSTRSENDVIEYDFIIGILISASRQKEGLCL